MSGIDDEQRAEWRDEEVIEYALDPHLARSRILALLDVVDTLRERMTEAESALEAGDPCGAVGCRAMDRLRDMEIERNMLRITTGELTERLAKVPAHDAATRAEERAKVLSEVVDLLSVEGHPACTSGCEMCEGWDEATELVRNLRAEEWASRGQREPLTASEGRNGHGCQCDAAGPSDPVFEQGDAK